ncbi:MAG: hypothetical protein AAFY81_05595 [Pseudomonadota bacterium]
MSQIRSLAKSLRRVPLANVTDVLLNWSKQQGRSYLFFKERPLDHWYPGAGVGLSFQPRAH